MADFAAFLRAVNLGARNRVSSDRLRAVFAKAGFATAQTFRTSGNVAFTAAEGSDPRALEELIEQALATEFGFEVATFVRSASDLWTIATQRPFPDAAIAASRSKLQVALLRGTPSRVARSAVLALGGEDDRLALQGAELYWLPSGGTRDSQLDLAAIARELGPMTMRAQGTITGLAQKYFDAQAAGGP